MHTGYFVFKAIALLICAGFSAGNDAQMFAYAGIASLVAALIFLPIDAHLAACKRALN